MTRGTDIAEMWVPGTFGTEAVGWERLVGGTSSAVWRVDLASGERIVVRHITDRDWLEREPDLIDRERLSLELLEDSAVPVPRCLATDAKRGLLAQSWVEGIMRFDADFLGDHVAAIAQIAVDIATTVVPADHGLPTWRPWAHEPLEPPPWGDAVLWSEAIERYRDGPRDGVGGDRLVHRDLHPLNLLWDTDGVAGVVDWVNACVGSELADLGHCRWNLTVLAGIDVADAFLDRFTRTLDLQYDPWWDLAPAMTFLPYPFGTEGWHAVRRTDITDAVLASLCDEFVGAALDRFPA